MLRATDHVEAKRYRAAPAFTLVELLVVIAIIALLIGLLLPGLRGARERARIVRAHADLRSCTQVLQMYSGDFDGALPPTRFSCSDGTAFPLPEELAAKGYLPRSSNADDRSVAFPDVFDESQATYRYRAPGPAWVNDSTYMESGSYLYVPDDAPSCRAETGAYVNDRRSSAVSYAVWSIGPRPDAAKLAEFANRLPLPRLLWLGDGERSGIITHFQDRDGRIYQSP